MKTLLLFCTILFSICSLTFAAGIGDLKNAIKLYKNNDYSGSAIDFYKILNDPYLSNYRSHIKIFLANDLFKSGYKAGAFHILEKLIEEGESGRYYQVALRKLAVISKLYSDFENFNRIMEKVSEENYPPKYESLIKFKLANYYIEKGEVDKALTLLSGITKKSPYHRRAKYIEGILYYKKGEFKKSIENFRYLVERIGFDNDMELEDQTLLAMGRIFYALGRYDLANNVYLQIPRNSRVWPTSLFESTWTLFMLGDYNKALGNLLTIYSPYFEDNLFHEMYIVEALIYFNLCLFKKAEESVAAFSDEFTFIKDELKTLLDRYKDDPIKFSNFILSDDFIEEVDPRIVLKIESDKRFKQRKYYIESLKKEQTKFNNESVVFQVSSLGEYLRATIDNDINEAEKSFGKMVYKMLNDIYNGLVSSSTEGDLIQFETVNREKEQLEQLSEEEKEIRYNLKEYEKITEGKIKKSSEYYYWPFAGEEFWVDELGDYVFTYESACKETEKEK